MDSPSWRVSCASVVNDFRKTLSPEEAELFNECLTLICRNPRADKIHKVALRIRLPLIDYMYRDDNFMIIYQWVEATHPVSIRTITVSRAARVSNFDQDNTVPKQ